MYHGDFDEDYECPGCGQHTGGSLCEDCQNEALWDFSWSLYHGPTAEQLRQAKKALEQEDCSSVTLFFSLHDEDEDGGLIHVTSLSLFPDSSSWDYEGTQWCKDFDHPEGGQSPVRGRWDPSAKNGWMDFKIPALPVTAAWL